MMGAAQLRERSQYRWGLTVLCPREDPDPHQQQGCWLGWLDCHMNHDSQRIDTSCHLGRRDGYGQGARRRTAQPLPPAHGGPLVVAGAWSPDPTTAVEPISQ